jgi:hypothetical protein
MYLVKRFLVNLLIQEAYADTRDSKILEYAKERDHLVDNGIIIIIIIIQFFITYVPIQQTQGQLQTQHSVDTSNYVMDKHNIKSKTNYRQALEEKYVNAEK